MSAWKRLSIARKLPLSVGALVVVVTTIMATLAYLEVRRGLIDTASERLDRVTRQLQVMLEHSARQSYATMTEIAGSDAVSGYLTSPSDTTERAALDLLATQARTSTTLRAVELWDSQGAPRLTSAPTAPPLDASTRARLIGKLGTSPSGFTDAYRPVGDTLESGAIVAIRRDSTVTGYFVLRRRVNATPQSIRNLSALIGSNARLMIGSRDGDVWTDLVGVVPGLPRETLADNSTVHLARSTGERVLARVVPLRTTDWLVAVEFLEAPILAPATRFLERALALALLLAVSGGLVGMVVSRSITKPLQEVMRAATGLAAGTDSTRVAIRRSDELGQLATSFNAMAEQLEASHKGLAGALERYRLLFDRNPVPMWLFDRETHAFLDVNEAAVRHYGYSRDEFLAMTLWDIRPVEDIPHLVAALSEPIDGPNRNRYWKHRRKDGSFIDVEVARTDIELQGKAASFALATDVTDRLAAERALATSKEQVDLQLGRLKALRSIDLAILGTTDLRWLLKSVLQEIMAQLRADAAVIFLFNPHTMTVDTSASIGYRTRAAERERVPLGDGVAGKAARERRTIAVPDLAAVEMSRAVRQVADEEGIRSVYAVPLIAKGQVIGVLDVLFREPFTASEDWLEFCEALAGQASMALDSCKSFEDLQRSNMELSLAYDRTIEGWSRALDLRDKETEGHTQRVTEMTLILARLAGIRDAELVHVRRGALLHDIGKMGIPDDILLKPDRLTDDEWAVMRKHPEYAVALLSPIDYLRPALDIPYCHHEKWDGSGYPRGLKGEQIPLSARLFSVVDVWDALRSDRPYRAGWPEEHVLDHIRAGSGTHFDPQAVDLFFRLVSEESNDTPVPTDQTTLAF
ncbi:MAG: HD domain-containing phosphohydrolase [Gemmatimonadaceae bacterium]